MKILILVIFPFCLVWSGLTTIMENSAGINTPPWFRIKSSDHSYLRLPIKFMNLHPNSLFHIYNRENNSQKIFFNEENYIFFLKKFRTEVRSKIDVLSYCLMPNHFHFLISTPKNFQKNEFANKWKGFLSSYTRAINKQEGRTGSLFQQKTKSKELQNQNQALVCFNYIHFNPVKATLVLNMEDWMYSSYQDYCGIRDGTLVNKSLSHQFLNIPKEFSTFKDFSNKLLPSNYQDLIF